MDVKQKKIDCIVNGFEKIASVIDGNLNYSYILGERLNNARYDSLCSRDGVVEADVAIAFLVKQLKKRNKFNSYDLTEEEKSLGLISYGKTNNNKKEIEFFNRSLRAVGVTVRQINIAEKNLQPISNHNELESVLEDIISAVKKYFNSRGNGAGLAILHQFISYIFSLISAIKTLQESSAKVILLPNDHSPVPVSFFVAGKIQNVKTVYLQHAEVTQVFPANNFDYSVLRNEKSLSVYNAILPVSGKVAIASRDASSFCLKNLTEKQESIKFGKKIDVCIYPSSVLNLEVLKKMFSLLNSNVKINNIYLKPHPAVTHYNPLEKMGYEVLGSHLDIPHVAIVGNSSVVVELVAKGCLVYQCFNLDDIKKDYYGFCEDGLAEEIELNDLSKGFWESKDVSEKDSAAIYQAYFPNLNSKKAQVQKANYELMLVEIALISKSISGEEYIEICDKIEFRKNLFAFTHAFLNYLRSGFFRKKEDFWFVKELNSLFDNRNVYLSELYNASDFEKIKSILDFWLLSKKIEWSGYSPSYEELICLIKYSQNESLSRKAGGWVELKMFDIMLRYSQPELLDDFIKKCKYLSLEKIGVNKKVAFIRYASLSNSKILDLHLADCYKNLSRLDKLKIEVQCFRENEGKLVYDNYIDVEQEFLDSLPALKEEYLSTVKKTYKMLGGRASFIDVRRNKNQRDELNSKVMKFLKGKKGFSLIRLSDGEGFLFQNESSYFTEEDSCNRQRHWWGVEINTALKNKIIEDAQIAIKNADIIGIPSIYRFLRDHSDKSKSLAQNLQGRGLLSVLEGVSTVDAGTQSYTDDKVNLALFNSLENLEALSNLAGKTIIVNSATEESALNAFKSLGDFVHIQIPTHNKTATNERYAKNNKQLPFVYQEIYDKIQDIAQPGDLVLVGAGVAGKVFIDAAKRNCAVGIDIGSAMDELVGGGIHSLF